MSDFDDIVAGVQIEVNEAEIMNVMDLPTDRLIELQGELEELLFDEEQALRPRTQEARDNHSLRNAIQVELSRRIGEIS